MTPADRSERIRRLARKGGFDAVGITRPFPPARADYYRAWLERGHAGQMNYLARHRHLREQPARILPGARSVICVAVDYARPDETPADPPATPDQHLPANPHRDPSAATHCGRVARYARGVDYHIVLREMLGHLQQEMARVLDEPFDARICVDSAPILERELAAAAGLGWIGKNTLVVNPRRGSYFVLGELVTTLDLQPDPPATDHCGTCTRCLDACPTQAFTAPYQMDASRCISYLTIELRGQIPDELAPRIGDWVFGCDICQEVCPFNRQAPPASQPQIAAERVPARLPLLDLVALRSGQYRRLTRDTALRRASRPMLRRNAVIALGNTHPAPPELQALRHAATDANEPLAAAAKRALHQR